MLFGVTSFDTLTFAGAAVVLTAVALAATVIPAYRAARIDPVRALRQIYIFDPARVTKRALQERRGGLQPARPAEAWPLRMTFKRTLRSD